MTRAGLGFFEQFKGADTVLLSTDSAGVRELARELEQFAASETAALRIPVMPIPGHEADLVAVREVHADGSARFRWLCGPSEVSDIVQKLNSLANSKQGHQYFELVGSKVQLMVSVGEYRA